MGSTTLSSNLAHRGAKRRQPIRAVCGNRVRGDGGEPGPAIRRRIRLGWPEQREQCCPAGSSGRCLAAHPLRLVVPFAQLSAPPLTTHWWEPLPR